MTQSEQQCQNAPSVKEQADELAGDLTPDLLTTDNVAKDPWRDQLSDSPLGLPSVTSLNQAKGL